MQVGHNDTKGHPLHFGSAKLVAFCTRPSEMGLSLSDDKTKGESR